MSFKNINQLTARELLNNAFVPTNRLLAHFGTYNCYEGTFLEDGIKVSMVLWNEWENSFGFNHQTTASVQASEIVDLPSDIAKACIYIDRGSVEEFQHYTIEEMTTYFNGYGGYIGDRPVYLLYRTTGGSLNTLTLDLSGGFLGDGALSQFSEDAESHFIVQGNNTYGNDGSNTIKSLWITSNAPIFDGYEDALDYMNTGNLSNAINREGASDTDPQKSYYFWNQELYKSQGEFSYAEEHHVSSHKLQIYAPPTTKVAGYITDEVPYNVKILVNGSVTKVKYNGAESTQIPTENVCTWQASNNVLEGSDGFYYYANFTKNIPIFDTLEDLLEYFDGTKGISDSKDGGGTESGHKNRTGTDIDDQRDDLNEATVKSAVTSLYVCDSSAVGKIAKAIYSTTTDIIDSIKEGLQLFGDPSQFITSLAYTPIDVQPFINSSPQGSIQLGAYNLNLEGASCDLVGYSGKLTEIANVFINETYGDFRDFDCQSFALFLPFMGTIPLETSQVINKLLTIKVAYDLHTMSLKYYIFVGGLLLESHDTNLGVSLPILSNDAYSKARENINGLTSILSSTMSAGTNVASGVSSGGASGVASTASSVVSSGMNIANNVMDILKRPNIRISGSQSSSTAIYDPFYPYLIIGTTETIKDENLYSQYGIPCYKIRKLSECRGYTEVADVHLEGNILPELKARIENKLRNGVTF